MTTAPCQATSQHTFGTDGTAPIESSTPEVGWYHRFLQRAVAELHPAVSPLRAHLPDLTRSGGEDLHTGLSSLHEGLDSGES